jgi:alpha-glucosidase
MAIRIPGWCVILLLFLSPARLSAKDRIVIKSPDQQIVFTFSLIKKSASYQVGFKSKPMVAPSPLGLVFADGSFGENLRIKGAARMDSTLDYELFTGKASQVHSRYRQVVIALQEITHPFRQVDLEVRVFDDGIAFRYRFPKAEKTDELVLLDEKTSFRFAGNPTVHTLCLPGYTSSHEGFYTHLPLNQMVEDTLMDMPTLLQYPDGTCVGITEAALLDYAGMYLSRQGDALVSKLSPLPGQTNVKVKARLPHHSPWRVLMIGDRVGTLMESHILTSLNAPCAFKDLSWLKPGKTTFPWWNGNVVPDTLNAPGNNFVTAQYYIDFCARNGIAYHSVVEYGLHQWYVDDGTNFQPGPNADVTTPVPGLNMQEICDYARTKGVGIRVWVHWAALYPKLDSAFALFEKWGLAGMMIDFMDRDDQQMVNIQTEMLQKAAAHRLHIQFHGAYKPSGLHRTYPNEFTREGTLNYETNKWDRAGLSPDHDIDIPFTRMLAGSTDYHLGGFRAVPPAEFKAQYTRPLMLGTRAHMLAMYVVLENYLQMLCDYPAAYEGEAGFSFLCTVPTTWDETLVLNATLNEQVTIARRKQDRWYLGAINNNKARTIPVSFGFLGEGDYTAEIFSDAADAAQFPNHLIHELRTINRATRMNLELAAGGGWVMVVSKK